MGKEKKPQKRHVAMDLFDKKTPVKAIREYCLECAGGNKQEVKACSMIKCLIWYYRMGHRPDLSKKLYQKEVFRDSGNLTAAEFLKRNSI